MRVALSCVETAVILFVFPRIQRTQIRGFSAVLIGLSYCCEHRPYWEWCAIALVHLDAHITFPSTVIYCMPWPGIANYFCCELNLWISSHLSFNDQLLQLQFQGVVWLPNAEQLFLPSKKMPKLVHHQKIIEAVLFN